LFGSKHYVPILRGKEGEYGAVRELAKALKTGITPFFDIPPIPMVFDDNGVGTPKDTDAHFQSVAKKIQGCWGTDRPLFVDLYWTPGSEQVSDGRSAYTYILDENRSVGVKVVPVTGLRRDADHQAAVRAALAKDQLGICVRLERQDFDDKVDLAAQLDALLKKMKVTVDQVDIIIDLRTLLAETATTEAKAARTLVTDLPYVQKWRTLTIAGSAFPKSLSDCGPDSINILERTEWLMWKALYAKQKAIPRMPTFADYAVGGPGIMEDIDPKMIRMSSNLRYTVTDGWLVFKGRMVRKYGNQQFRGHCAVLIKRGEYSGENYSWGDTRIYHIATDPKVSPGNPMIWRKIGTSHHITFVKYQIASLP
jgi:hypothetical protein